MVPNRPIPPELVERIKDLRRAGLTYLQIHKETGVSIGKISEICREIVPKEPIEVRLNRIEEKLRSYELYIGKVRELEEMVKKHEKQIANATPCFTSILYRKFKCDYCGAERLYAAKFKCTKCGRESWWGYWPE